MVDLKQLAKVKEKDIFIQLEPTKEEFTSGSDMAQVIYDPNYKAYDNPDNCPIVEAVNKEFNNRNKYIANRQHQQYKLIMFMRNVQELKRKGTLTRKSKGLMEELRKEFQEIINNNKYK